MCWEDHLEHENRPMVHTRLRHAEFELVALLVHRDHHNITKDAAMQNITLTKQ